MLTEEATTRGKRLVNLTQDPGQCLQAVKSASTGNRINETTLKAWGPAYGTGQEILGAIMGSGRNNTQGNLKVSTKLLNECQRLWSNVDPIPNISLHRFPTCPLHTRDMLVRNCTWTPDKKKNADMQL